MYTRNYRIQHSDRRAEPPRDEETFTELNEKGETFGGARDGSADVVAIDEKRDDTTDTASKPEAAEESAFSEEQSEEKASAPRKLRAVRHYRVRSSAGSQSEAVESENSEEAEREKETRESESIAEPAVTEREEMFEMPRTEGAQGRHFVGRQERSFDKKPFGFGANPFGIKNFSPEDIFLAAILLLLLNEGCEDIMTLILGFLLIS